MSHYRGYVVSFDEKVKEPWMPDEEAYNEQVQCGYCDIEDLPKKELRDSFVGFLENILPYIPHQIKGVVLKDGTVKVTIPKGCIRKFLEREIGEIRAAASEMTPENYRHGGLTHLVDYCNPFTTVFVEIGSDGNEEYDTYRRALSYALESNDKKDTAVYVYGSINHHA